jgi:hypothetical protein
LFEVASLLIYHVFGVVPLLVTVPLTMEALGLRFGFNLGYFTEATTGLPFMKFPF